MILKSQIVTLEKRQGQARKMAKILADRFMMKKLKAKVYIDGANIFYIQKDIGFSIDWKKMKDYLQEKWDILEMRYYVGIKQNDEKMNSDFDYLAKKLRDLGKKVTVFSSRKMLSWELKLTTKSYVFFEDLKTKIERK